MRRISLLIVISLLAGCAADAPELSESADPDTEPDDENGRIEGLVLDASLNPIEGATVTLDSEETQTSGVYGAFVFASVEPGSHELSAARPGYVRSTQEIHVEANDVAVLNLVLEAIPSPEGYHETIPQDGFVTLTLAYSLSDNGSSPINPGVVTNDLAPEGRQMVEWSTEMIGFGPDVSGIWVETTWTPNQALGNEMAVNWMLIDEQVTTENFAFADLATVARTQGESPLVAPVLFEDIVTGEIGASGDVPCSDLECYIYSNHVGHAQYILPDTPPRLGLSFQQRFTDYITTFHNEPLPETFSASATE